MAGFSQKRSLAGASRNVRLLIRKRTIEPITAAHNDHSVGNVCFAISKRKKSANSDFAVSVNGF